MSNHSSSTPAILRALSALVALSILGVAPPWARAEIVPELLIAPVGPGADALFGIGGASAGDFNNDGYDDVIFGASGETGPVTGRAFVYFGGPGADATADLTLFGAGGVGEVGDAFGRVVDGIGDFNADGIDDILVTAFREAAGGTDKGRAYVFYGGDNPDATADLVFGIAEAEDNTRFGISGSAAGDVNNDGVADIVIGHYQYDTGATNRGRAYVYYGGPNPDVDADLTFTGLLSGDSLGRWVAGAGDVNADGFDDVIIGADGVDGDGSTNSGAAYVFYGGPNADNTADLVFTDVDGDRVGRRVDGAGDLNGDGFDDLVVGDDEYDSNGTDRGRVWLFWGGPQVDTAPDLVLDGEAEDSNFGRGASSGGDLNDDGFDDLIVGAFRYGPSDNGRAYVYYGGPAIDSVPDIVLTGEAGGDILGLIPAPAGDFNADGIDDFLVGAHWNDEGGDLAGKGYVYAGPGSYGGCCLAIGCLDLTELDCTALGGTPLEDGVFCADNDTDGDGTGDACDECPLNPEKVSAGLCGCEVDDELIAGRFLQILDVSGSQDGEFDTPEGVAVDALDRVYVADRDNHRIQVFDDDLQHVLSFGSVGSGDGQLDKPIDVDVSADGTVWVLESGNHRVSAFDTSGNFLFKFGSQGSGDGEFNSPEGIDVDSQNRVIVSDPGNARIEVFDSNGSFLFTFGSAGSGNGQFSQPRKVTTDTDDNIYVVDRINRRVQVFDPAGNYLSQFGTTGTGDGQFQDPWAIEISNSGRLFVADLGRDDYQEFTLDGTFLGKFGSNGFENGEFHVPRGIAADSKGAVYVTDAGAERIQKIAVVDCVAPCCLPNGCMDLLPTDCAALGGTILPGSTTCADNDFDGDGVRDECDECPSNAEKVLAGDCGCGGSDLLTDLDPGTQFGSPGSGPGQFQGLRGVSLDGAGRIYTVEIGSGKGGDRVQVFSPSGTSLLDFDGGVALSDPNDVAVAADGRIYVVERLGSQISVFDRDGNFLFEFGGFGANDGDLNFPSAIAIDGQGRLVVTDTNNHRVQIFDSAGNFVSKFGTQGSGSGELDTPFGVAIDAQNRIHVTEVGNDRVQVFSATGTSLFEYDTNIIPVLTDPGHIDIDAAGNAHVIDPVNQQVRLFDPDGNLLLNYAVDTEGLFEPNGIAVDLDGNAWIGEAEAGTARMQRYDPVPQVVSLDASDGILETGTVLTWSPVCDMDALWKITRDGEQIAVLPQSDSTFVDTGGLTNVVYTYELTFVDRATGFEASDTDTGFRTVFAPDGLTATDGSREDGVQLRWNDRSSIEVGQRIFRRDDGSVDPFAMIDSVGADIRVYIDSSAVLGTRYEYCIEAVTEDGGETGLICDNDGQQVEGEIGTLNAPLALAASDGVYTDRVLITWQDATTLEDGYIVSRRAAGSMDAFTFLDSIPVDSSSFTDMDSVGTAWEYSVTAFRYEPAPPTFVESSRSLDDGIGGIDTMTPPANVMASDDDFDDRITIIWDDPGDDETKFVIYRDGQAIGEVSGSTQFNDQDVVAGVSTEYCVQAVSDLGGTSLQSAACDTGTRAEIIAPTDLTATQGEFENRTVLTWNAESTTATVFEVFREDLPIKILPGSARTYTDKTGLSGVRYNYYVRGLTVTKAASDTTGRAAIGYRKLESPTNVTATDGTIEDRVALTWEDNSSFETGYFVLRRIDGNTETPDLLAELRQNQTSYTDLTADVGVDYEYQVVPIDDQGRDTTPVSDTGRRDLNAVSDLTATDDEFENQIQLEWQDGSSAETGFAVWRDGVLLVKLPAGTETYADSGLAIGAFHTYQVFPIDEDDPGVGPLAPPTNTPSDSGSTELLPPASVSASDTYTDRVTISWVDQSNSETGFEILQGSEDAGLSLIGTVSANVTTFSDPSPPPAGESRNYYVRTLSTSSRSELAFDPGSIPTTTALPIQIASQSFNIPRGLAATDGETLVIADGVDTTSPAIYSYQRSATGEWENVQIFEATGRGQISDVSLDGEWLYVLHRTEGHETLWRLVDSQWTLFSTNLSGPNATQRVFVNGNRRAYLQGFKIRTAEWDGSQWNAADDIVDFNAVFEFSLAMNKDGKTIIARDNNQVRRWILSGSDYVEQSQILDEGCGSTAFGQYMDISGERIILGGRGCATIWEDGVQTIIPYGGPTDVIWPRLDGDYAIIGNRTGADPITVYLNDPKLGWTPQFQIDEPNGIEDIRIYNDGGVVTFRDTNGDDIFVSSIVAPPTDVTASDNEFDNKVRVSWTDSSADESGFRVFRDGNVLADVEANTTSYNDFDARPGVAHDYQVAATAFGLESGFVGADHGRRPADGSITGRITTSSGVGVDDVTVCLDPPASRSVLFDGIGGYVGVDDALPVSSGFTIELWATVQDLDATESRILWTSDDGLYLFGMNPPGNFVLQTPSTANAYDLPSDRGWHHYAVTVSSGGVGTLYIDGVAQGVSSRPAQNIALGAPIFGGSSNTGLTIGGDPAGGFWWSGQVDDCRVWSQVLTVNEIAARKELRLPGNTAGLFAYLSFDEPDGLTTSDLTGSGLHGTLVGGVGRSDLAAPIEACATTDAEGNYAITEILYGDGRTFEVIPTSTDRTFTPSSKIVSLDQENPVVNEVGFGDATSFSVSGYVGYENTACSAEGIEILVDGVLAGQTDANGEFELAVTPGPHTISARAEGLDLAPTEIEIDGDRDLANQDFEITTKRRLRLSVGGGCPGVEIGDITLTVTSADGCRQVDLVVSDSDEIELPPLEVRAEVTNVTNAPAPLNNGLIQEFFDFNGPQTIDLATEDGTLDFIYRAPITMTVAGLPEWSCGPFLGPDNQVISGTPDGLMKMLQVSTLTFTVFEDYGTVTCPVDSGTVTIFDEVADRTTAQVVSITNGTATYPLIAARPNTFAGRTADGLDRSFQKAVTAVADAGGSTDRLTRWVVVEGARPRSGTFYSGITEDNPILILHDPPGDQSYSYWERGLEACTLIGNMTIDGDGDTDAVDLQAGLDVSIGASIGFLSISKDTRAVGSVGFAFEHEASTTADGDVQYCVRTTQRFTTSDDDLFVGPPGDVFVGSAMNVLFAPADNLTIDDNSCQASTFESIRFGLDGDEPFATTFAYTRGHIENVLIPQFERLMQSPSAADSVDIYRNQIDNWRAQLALADSLTAQGLRGEGVENRSFSAGAIFEATTEADSSSVSTKTMRIYSKDETLGGFNFKTGGFGTAGNFSGSVSYETNTLTGSSADTTLTTGYVLSDDDVGDFFTTDIGIDPTYGTPVFELRSGTSSCPWEPGTAPRDSVGIILDQYILSDQDPNAPAELRLTMTNFSKELREYYLRSEEIENVGGATIKVNGIDAAVPRSFFIGPEQSKDIVVTVERGPRLFNYPNLRLQAIPPCELELFRRGDQLRLASALDFSVFFQAPCSDITISSPESGWVFNKDDEIATGNILTVRLSDFVDQLSENGDEEVSGVNIEWRRVGSPDGFTTILNEDLTAEDLRDINGNVLPSIDVLWDLSNRDDGQYELRAYTKCQFNGSTVYSNISSGTIDRTDPQPFGDPEPADQDLALGDQIQIDFNETISCNSVSSQTVELTVTGQPDPIPVNLECNGTSIIIDPAPLGLYEGQTATVRVGQLDPQNPDQTILDVAGNPLLGRDDVSRTESWSFDIRLSDFAWARDFIVQPVTFEAGGAVGAKLVNGNETDLDFDINGVPGWLTPSVTSGTITAGGTFDVEFAFPDSLGASIIQNFPDSTATFQATVTADVTTPPLSVPLDIRVDVTCGPPTWDVSAGLFEYTMSAVVQLNIDSQISTDSDDIVAAFVGNQLRGVSRVDGDQAFLTIYSNRAVGEIVRFKIFDASMCDLYGASDRTVRFEVDKRWGNPSAPQILTALDVVPGVTQAVDVGEGWTWFSLNLLDQDMTIFTVLGDLNPEPGDVVKSQTEFSVLDEDLEWQGSLTEFDNREGYLINLTESGTILHQGDAVNGDLPIQISPGWNWIGYPPANTDSVNVALASFAANDFDVIKSQTEFAQYIDGLGWTGSLKVMEPGQGYKLYSGQALPGVLMFPANPAPLARGEFADGGPGTATGKLIRTTEDTGDMGKGKRAVRKSRSLSPALKAAFDLGWSLPQRGFQHNMTMIAKIELDGAPLSGPAVLGAFVGEEVRGVAELTPLGLEHAIAFLMIHSDEAENEEVTFQVLNTQTDELYDVRTDVDFIADGSLGTIEAPWTLQAVPSMGDTDVPISFQLSESFPNPARLSPAQIGYGLPTETFVDIQLFDVQGRAVRTLVNEAQPAGRYVVEVDPVTLSSGIYFYRMRTDAFEQVRKLTVVR